MSSCYAKADFVQGIAQLLFYQTATGNMYVPEDYVTADKFPLGEFVKDVRRCYQDHLLAEEQEERLEEIGFAMDDSQQAWKSLYRLTREYTLFHKGKLPDPTERTPDNVLLGAWVRKQRLTFYQLRPKQQERLRRIGICVG